MAIDLFETRTMLTALEQMYPVSTFFVDTFFRNATMVNSTHVDIDIYKGGQQLAPFQSPHLQARTVDKKGFETKSYTFPSIKIKGVCTAFDVLSREMGSTIYDQSMSPNAKAQQLLGQQLQDMLNMIRRREEAMAAQLLDLGYFEAIGDGINLTVDFELPVSHRYTVATLWSSTTADVFADLRAAADLVARDSGIRPDILVMGADVIKYFMDRVGDKLDNMRLVLTADGIKPQNIPAGAQYWGRLLDSGLDVYSYSAFYKDEAGTSFNIMPTDRVFIGSTNAYTSRYYGMIQDLDVTAAVQYYPKTWTQPDPSAMFLSVQSKPLLALHQVDAFASIEVV